MREPHNARARRYPPGRDQALLPDVMIVGATEPYLMRLVGDNIVRVVGRNYTGQPVTSGLPPEGAASLVEIFRQIVETRAPSFRIGMAFWLPDKAFLDFESALLPLSPDDGDVDLILGGMRFDTPR